MYKVNNCTLSEPLITSFCHNYSRNGNITLGEKCYQYLHKVWITLEVSPVDASLPCLESLVFRLFLRKKLIRTEIRIVNPFLIPVLF